MNERQTVYQGWWHSLNFIYDSHDMAVINEIDAVSIMPGILALFDVNTVIWFTSGKTKKLSVSMNIKHTIFWKKEPPKSHSISEPS